MSKDEDACSASKPWAVKGPGGKVFGCHTSKADAEDQQAALYANTDAAAAFAAAMEFSHMKRVASKPYSVADLPVPVIEDQNETTDSGISLVTMKSVPLMCVGMEFPASTGPVTFDFGHLAAAVMAGADPTIPRPRIKLGHTDPRYNNTFCPHCKVEIEWEAWANNEHVFDAMPNFGFVETQVLENEGAWLYGDLVDIPEWLASVMPVAYPSRSIEGWFGYEGLNDKEYKFIVTDLALLGVVFPGVMNLADLPSLYGKDKPAVVVFDHSLVEVPA